MSTKSRVFVDVIPLARLPWNAPFYFTYALPERMARVKGGELVRVPFRRHTIAAVVVSISKRIPEFPVKEIQARAPSCALPIQYLDYCVQVAESTLNHPARFIMQNIVPALNVAEAMRAIQKVGARSTLNARTALQWVDTRAERDAIILDRVYRFTRTTHLVLAPTVDRARAIHKNIQDAGKEAYVIAGNTPLKERREVIRKLLQKIPLIVVGTRSAVFLPFAKLGAITVDDEANPNYKQDSPPPRYHARRAFELLNMAHRADLLLVDSIPSLGVYARYAEGQSTSTDALVLPHHQACTAEKQVCSIIDSTTYNSFVEPLNPFVREAIKKNILEGSSVLVLAAQQGYAPILTCRDCRLTFKCPTCKSLLAREARDAPSLECRLCGYQEAIPPLCPRCNGARLVPGGFGVKRIAEYLRTLDIGVVHEWSVTRKGGEPACYVGALSFSSEFIIPKLSLIVLQSVDPLLARTSYAASEQVWQVLGTLVQCVSEQGGSVMIQTSVPDHPVFAVLRDPVRAYRDELQLRAQFHYPPFGHIIWIGVPQGKGNADKKIHARIAGIKKPIESLGFNVTDTVPRRRRGNPVLAFTLRYTHAQMPIVVWKKLVMLLKAELPRNAVIDVDPDMI